MASRSSKQDPLKNFRYAMIVPGFARIGFESISGLKSSTESIDYREGGDEETPRKSAGQTTYEPITCTRGQIVDPDGEGEFDFYIWRLMVKRNDPNYRRDIVIIQYNRDRTEARRWLVSNVWPNEDVAFSDLKGTGNEDSIESLTLQHEGYEIEGGPQPPGVGKSLEAALGI